MEIMATAKIGAGKYIERMRDAVKPLLPDTCRIVPRVSIETDSGAWEETDGEPLFYKGNQDIPCRVDPTSHHREEDIFEQERIVNEYKLWLPIDAPIYPNHKVQHGDKTFDIRKIAEDHSWGLLKSALIVEVI
jgi:hypothetical protein